MSNTAKRIAIFAILFFVVFFTCKRIYSSQITVPESRQNTVAIQKKQSIIFFYRSDCAYCKKVYPLVKIASTFKLPVQFVNTKNNINRTMAITRYKIKAVPTFIYIDKNGNEKTRYTGSDFKEIKKLFNK